MSEKPFYEKYSLAKQFWYKGLLCSANLQSAEVYDKLTEAEIRESDVFIATYPKSGTTWVAEIASILLEDGNYHDVNDILLIHRAPYADFLQSIEEFDNMSHNKPRLIRTHLMPDLLPTQLKTKGKIITVWRDPKDVAVSYYYFYKLHEVFNWYDGTWAEFLDAFMQGYVHCGSIFEYTKAWFEETKQDRVLVVRYEDLKRDPRANVRKIAEFLGKVVDEDTVERIVLHTSFSKMKDNKMTNCEESVEAGRMRPDKAGCRFFRKGETGDWKNHFTVAQNEAFEKLASQYNEFPRIYSDSA